jgi:hypothetical protein
VVEGSVLRLFTFGAARPAFDEILRDRLVPDLSAQHGVIDCYSGRQGPGEVGPRIVASVWADRAAMVAAVGDRLGQFHPELLDETVDRMLEVFPIRLASRAATSPAVAPTILRTLRGQVRDGGLDEYLDDVKEGVDADERAGVGPIALYVAETGPDAFITMSAWRAWADIEHATGGDIHQPRATRHREHLLEWDVAHFEVVQIQTGRDEPSLAGAPD